MAGRKIESVDSILEKGNKPGLTKEEIKDRRETEAMARGPCDNIEPPKYLTAKQKKEFSELAAELIRVDLLTNLDVDTLAQYIDARSQYVDIVKAIRKFKPIQEVADENTGESYLETSKAYASLQRTKGLVIRQCRSIAAELGLTLDARQKLIIPKNTKPEVKKSKWSKWVN